jgi:hypothetical protein
METTLGTADFVDPKTAMQFLCKFYRMDSGVIYYVGVERLLFPSPLVGEGARRADEGASWGSGMGGRRPLTLIILLDEE